MSDKQGGHNWTAQSLAAVIDHTVLRPEATAGDVARLCEEAMEWGFATACVNPRFVEQAVSLLAGTEVGVCSVAGFPLGASTCRAKSYEAAEAFAAGAREVDMVIPVGAAVAGDLAAVAADVEAVVAARDRENAEGIVKVILETAVLEEEMIRSLCQVVSKAGADFLKTSTGFHPAGGATVDAVRLLSECRGGCRVKAAGGIRTLEQALAMLEAGADRLGTSSGVAIAEALPGQG